MLGRPYLITGRVIHGAHRGRLLGFPTANLELPANRLLPGSGVYLVRSFFAGETRFGLANIGLRPTFARSQPAAGSQTVAESESKAENQRTTEIYLLDTSADLYGKTMTLEFLAFIREERRFPSTAALVAQMKKDLAGAPGPAVFLFSKQTLMVSRETKVFLDNQFRRGKLVLTL